MELTFKTYLEKYTNISQATIENYIRAMKNTDENMYKNYKKSVKLHLKGYEFTRRVLSENMNKQQASTEANNEEQVSPAVTAYWADFESKDKKSKLMDDIEEVLSSNLSNGLKLRFVKALVLDVEQ